MLLLSKACSIKEKPHIIMIMWSNTLCWISFSTRSHYHDYVWFLLNAACFTEKQHTPNCIVVCLSRSQSTTFEAITLTITPPIYSTSDTCIFKWTWSSISLKINLFSPWYSWNIDEFAINNNQPVLTILEHWVHSQV
jgi:hypothetical protein